MTLMDWLLIIVIVVAAILGGLLFFNRWAAKKYGAQQDMLDKSKMVTSIFVLNKKKMRLKDANLPKIVLQNIPKFYTVFKMPMVQAKIGNKVMNLICDKKVFKKLELKKNCKVEMAGIYILNFANGKKDTAQKLQTKVKYQR